MYSKANWCQNLSSEVCNHVRHKAVCSASEASKSHSIVHTSTFVSLPNKQLTEKALIRLYRCYDWSPSLLLAYGINRFSYDMAHLIYRQDLIKRLIQIILLKPNVLPTFLTIINLKMASFGNTENIQSWKTTESGCLYLFMRDTGKYSIPYAH